MAGVDRSGQPAFISSCLGELMGQPSGRVAVFLCALPVSTPCVGHWCPRRVGYLR